MGLADAFGELALGELGVVVEGVAVAAGLLEGGEVVAVEALDEHQLAAGGVVEVADLGRDGGEAGFEGGGVAWRRWP